MVQLLFKKQIFLWITPNHTAKNVLGSHIQDRFFGTPYLLLYSRGPKFQTPAILAEPTLEVRKGHERVD